MIGIPVIADRIVQAALSWCWNQSLRPTSSRSLMGFGLGGELRTQSLIDHAALMDRVRSWVKDKRVLALVKSFLKAGLLTELGET